MTDLTRDERAAIYTIGNALCAPPIQENLNDACNRRAQLALSTVVAAIRSRRFAIEQEVPENEAQKVSSFAKLCLIEDLLDDLIAIRKGFGHGA